MFEEIMLVVVFVASLLGSMWIWDNYIEEPKFMLCLAPTGPVQVCQESMTEKEVQEFMNEVRRSN